MLKTKVNQDKEQVVLKAETELRIELENDHEPVSLELVSGTAEIFGAEIVVGKKYEFTRGAKFAIFTWEGCDLSLWTSADNFYVAKDTPMLSYLNVHVALEQDRESAAANDETGPIAMLVGPTDVGKSTLSKILLNYAVRINTRVRKPIFVDLDIGQGYIGVPGTIGATTVEQPVLDFDGISNSTPVVFHYGYTTGHANPGLFNTLISGMAKVIRSRLKSDRKARESGVIINTMGWVKNQGYKYLLDIGREFNVHYILVLGQEKLYNQLRHDTPPAVVVTMLSKSGGVVERSTAVRQACRAARIRQYFYGSATESLNPYSFDVRFSDVSIFRIGTPSLPASCLPLGMKLENNLTKLVPVTPSTNLLHHILSISLATSVEDDIVSTNVAGFVCVTNIDMEKQLMTLLAPQPKPLPSTILLLSEAQFIDGH